MTYSSEPVSDRRGQSTAGVPEATGWTGWIAFAGVMMVLLGTFHAIEGLVAIFDDGYYLVSQEGLVVSVDYTGWGWAHLLLGIIVALAGVSLFAGRMWARIVAVLASMLSAVVNIVFFAAFPFWSATMIVLNILIIWAVMVHGSEMKSDEY